MRFSTWETDGPGSPEWSQPTKPKNWPPEWDCRWRDYHGIEYQFRRSADDPWIDGLPKYINGITAKS